MKGRIYLLLCLLAVALSAEDIELWNGKFIRDIEIYQAENGWLYYRRSDDSTSKAKLIDIKNIVWQDRLCQITRFSDTRYGRRSGKLLGLAVDWEGERMPQPLVRVYALQEEENGRRELRLYQNIRVPDPTRTEKLPEVDAQAYRQQLFFVDQAVAYHIEVWIGGIQRVEQTTGDAGDLLKGWWRRKKLNAISSLTRLTDEKLDKAQKIADRQDAKQQTGLPDCRIETFSLNPEPGRKNPKLRVRYSLGHPKATSVPQPQVRFHYILEDMDGNREIQSLVCQAGGRQVKLERGLYEGRVEKALANNLRINPTLIEFKKEGVKQLIYWRLEFLYKDRLIAVREENNRTIKRTLPDGWWK